MLKIDRILHEIDENTLYDNEVSVLDRKPTVSLI